VRFLEAGTANKPISFRDTSERALPRIFFDHGNELFEWIEILSAGSSFTWAAYQGATDFSRQPNKVKAAGGKGIVFPAFIDDANVAMGQRLSIGDHSIEFSDLKGSWIAFIFKTKSKLPGPFCSSFRGSSRKGRVANSPAACNRFDSRNLSTAIPFFLGVSLPRSPDSHIAGETSMNWFKRFLRGWARAASPVHRPRQHEQDHFGHHCLMLQCFNRHSLGCPNAAVFVAKVIATKTAHQIREAPPPTVAPSDSRQPRRASC
jgi:hypothetical protein